MRAIDSIETQPAVAPEGRVTLVFTDIEGSTSLWEQAADAMRAGLELHHQIVRTALDRRRGYEVKSEGDGFMVAFSDALDALDFCNDVQLALLAAPWPAGLLARPEAAPIERDGAVLQRGPRVRMGLHVGYPEALPDRRTGLVDYYGPMVNRAARIAAAANGGQIVVSGAAWDELGARGGAALRGVDWVDLGWHKLRGLEEPERLRQVLPHALGARRFPPVRTLEIKRTNLVEDTTSFVGRGGELNALSSLFAGGARLVTLLGPGGAGKTRLARRLGEILLRGWGQDGGGVWFCDLSEARSLADVMGAVGAALGVPLGSTEQASVTALGDALADRGRLLLVLDNCEQIVESAAHAVERWLKQSQHLHLLVTSRIPLGLPGEERHILDPLKPSDGVQLFLERARTVRRDRALGDEDHEAIERLVARLDGLPLAIELAAARAAVMSPAAILDRLDRRFELLRAQGSLGPARHRTLRAAIDWSWELLDPWERRALTQCAVFAGPFSLAAAEATLSLDDDAPWVLDLLHTLHEKSLLRVETRADGERLFRMLESVASYALARLEAAPEAEARHAAWYASWGRKLAARLHGPGAERRRAELVAESDNLRAVIERSLDAPEHARQGVEATIVLSTLLLARGPFDAALASINLVEPLAHRLADPRLLAELLICRSHLELATEQSAKAELTVRSALNLLDVARDAVLFSRAQHHLGNVLLAQRRPEEAEIQLNAALQATPDDPAQRAILHVGLCRGARMLGQIDRAQALIELALEEARAGRDLRAEAMALTHQGVNAAHRRDLRRAAASYQAALPLLVQCGDRRTEASLRNNLGSTSAVRANSAEAQAYYLEALEIFRELGMRGAQAETLGNLLELHLEYPALEGATRVIAAARQVSAQIGDRRGEHRALATQGALLLAEGDREAAREALRAAAALPAESVDPRLRLAALVLLDHARDPEEPALDLSAELEAAADLTTLARQLRDPARAGPTLAGARTGSEAPTQPQSEPLERRLLRRALAATPDRAQGPAALPPAPAATARRFELGPELGRGGFGTVYKAELQGEAGFRTTVAVKLLNRGTQDREELARRLRDEARVLGLLRHRAIVTVFGLEPIDGSWAIVMEYIDGFSLSQATRQGPTPARVALGVIGELASALRCAWSTRGPDGRELRLVHRDIKPGNVLISRAGEVKLLDFGIARAELTSREALTEGRRLGTPGYIAPERFEGRDGPEADIYSLGVLLFELLGGAPLGPGSANPPRHAAKIAEALSALQARTPGLPEATLELLPRLLACDPADRPSAAELDLLCEAMIATVPGPQIRPWASQIAVALTRVAAPETMTS